MATVLKHYKISPAADAVSKLSLPLLFFDMLWYDQPPIQFVFFFKTNCSKSHFLDEVVRDLKRSLSLTLTHFLPLAGNIVHPLTPGDAVKSVLQFIPGQDYVSFTVCEASTNNFNHLVGNHPRNCNDFYCLVPDLPVLFYSPDSIQVPAVALKATIFPGSGICLGFTGCHVGLDASTILSFFRAWAFINTQKHGKVEEDVKPRLQEADLLPFYDRSAFADINGLDSIYWGLIKGRPDSLPVLPWKPPGEKVRCTMVLQRDEIQKLKNYVSTRVPGVQHLSSFCVVCGLVWSCLAKSAVADRKEVSDDEPDYFSYPADCRGKANVDQPLPRNYLGSCLASFTISMKHGELKGDDGFVRAAVLIGEAVEKTVYNEEGILHGAEEWLLDLWSEGGKRVFWVGGSPRFDFYKLDFGWGRPVKMEQLEIDKSPSMSLWKSRWAEGGVEIGLAKPKAEMEAFITVFNQFLE